VASWHRHHYYQIRLGTHGHHDSRQAIRHVIIIENQHNGCETWTGHTHAMCLKVGLHDELKQSKSTSSGLLAQWNHHHPLMIAHDRVERSTAATMLMTVLAGTRVGICQFKSILPPFYEHNPIMPDNDNLTLSDSRYLHSGQLGK